MERLDMWFESIQQWYENKETRQFDSLANLLSATPTTLFSSPITQEKSDAIAYFVDACNLLQRHYQHTDRDDDAYSYMQFCYAKLQALASDPQAESDVKRWSLKKLDQCIVTMMEFCQHQGNDSWLLESEQLVELHIAFMLGQNERNLHLAQGF